MSGTIRDILRAAVQAPSGGNSQPWSFEAGEHSIRVRALPEKDHALLNFRHRGTWLAHGALLENLEIAAQTAGYDTRTRLFPDGIAANVSAEIELIPAPSRPHSLQDAIFTRATNRKPYRPEPLAVTETTELEALAVPGAEVTFTGDQSRIRRIAEAVSLNETVMLENPELHRLFFREIVWTGAEEHRKKSGLYLKTMELAPPKRFALRIFRYWPVMRFANRLGMAKKIASENAEIYAKTSFLGTVTVDDRDEAFLDAGRLIQRIWLTATRLGLAGHLITGIPFLWQRVRAGEAGFLSDRHRQTITEAYRKLAEAAGVERGLIAGVLRLGRAAEPSARSSRLEPDIVNMG